MLLQILCPWGGEICANILSQNEHETWDKQSIGITGTGLATHTLAAFQFLGKHIKQISDVYNLVGFNFILFPHIDMQLYMY